MRGSINLKMGKVAIITGGSSDIGVAIVKKFIEEGTKVYSQYNSNPINLENPNLFQIKSDFLKFEEIDSLVEYVLKKESKVDYLVNAAGTIEGQNFLVCSSEKIENLFQVNLFSHIYLMQKIFPLMLENKFGRIISLSSIGVKYSGSINSTYYSASKSALESVTRSYAKFGAESNVLCNNIRVGVVDTKIHKNKDLSARTQLIPVKRLGRPEDIAGFVSYLCSEKGDFITGQDIAISGGE